MGSTYESGKGTNIQSRVIINHISSITILPKNFKFERRHFPLDFGFRNQLVVASKGIYLFILASLKNFFIFGVLYVSGM
jgi:hypothetical protein